MPVLIGQRGTATSAAAAAGVARAYAVRSGAAAGASSAAGKWGADVGRYGVAAGFSPTVGGGGPAGKADGVSTALGDAGAFASGRGTAAGVSTVGGHYGSSAGVAGEVAGRSAGFAFGDGPFDLSFLLPRNQALFETAVSRAMMDRLPVPLREIVDPFKTPAAFLPFLAAHQSVDLWYSDWPESRQRTVIANGMTDAALKGTRAGAIQYLSYVDGTLLDAQAYAMPFIAGEAIIGYTPVGLPSFVANYLVKVVTFAPKGAFVAGQSAAGHAAAHTASTEPFDRCITALRVGKAPETEIRVDFSHKRLLTFGDAPLLDGAHHFGEFVDRHHL